MNVYFIRSKLKIALLFLRLPHVARKTCVPFEIKRVCVASPTEAAAAVATSSSPTPSHDCTISQLVQKARVQLDNEIACISLNPPSNQPVSNAEPATAAMECDEESKLDSLVAVGMWTDMTVRFEYISMI